MPSFDEVPAILEQRPTQRSRQSIQPQTHRHILLGLVGLAASILTADPVIAAHPLFNSTQTIYASSVQIQLNYQLPQIQLYPLPYGLSEKQRWRNALRKQHAAAANAAKAQSVSLPRPAVDPLQAGADGPNEEELLRTAVHTWAAGRRDALGPRARRLINFEANACSISVDEYVKLYLETEARQNGAP